MADVRPFRGVTYDPRQVPLERVICDPYDVISPAQQAGYLARDPHNYVRIVHNPAPGEERYSRAAADLCAWIGEGVLRQSEEPALYVHRHGFADPAGAGRITRTGVIAAVRLEPWSRGTVKPHEHTMPGPKEDRLRLMRATGADTEPIWVFHPDEGGAVRAILNEVVATPPTLSIPYRSEPIPGSEAGEELHEVWEVSGEPWLSRLTAALGAVQLYIADGHHRYETALFRAQEAGGGPDAATRFKVMLISPYEDPGLLVLPTHRLINLPDGRSMADVLATLRDWGWRSEQPARLPDLVARLAAPAARGNLGFGLFTEGRFSYLEGTVPGAGLENLPPAVAGLDVAVIHQGILEPLCGIDIGMAGGPNLAFTRDAGELVQLVRSGEYAAGLLLRPPTLAQVRAVADAGENMPQKSTYFWPKPASGLVLALQQEGLAL